MKPNPTAPRDDHASHNLGRFAGIAGLVSLVSFILLWGVGLLGRLGENTLYALIGLIAWCGVGLGFAMYWQYLAPKRATAGDDSMWSMMLRVVTIAYIVATAIVIYFTSARPGGLQVGSEESADSSGIDVKRFHPDGISELHWRGLEVKYGRNAIGRVFVTQIPFDDSRFRERIIREMSAGRPHHNVCNIDRQPLELVTDVKDLGTLAERCPLLRRESVNEELRTVVLVFDRPKAEAALFADRLEKERDRQIVRACVADENVRSVELSIERYSRAKVAVVEFENPRGSKDHRDYIVAEVYKNEDYGSAHSSPDHKLIEAVFAPVDDLDELARRLAAYHPTNIDKELRRITCRPDQEALQKLVEDRQGDEVYLEFSRSLERSASYCRERRREMQRTYGDSHVAVVNVLHLSTGAGRDKKSVYDWFRRNSVILSTGGPGDDSAQFIIQVDDLAHFIATIDLGAVVRFDAADRAVVVDLDVKNAIPIDPHDPAAAVPAVFSHALFDLDRREMSLKYDGPRVAELVMKNMPDDESERAFVRTLIADGRKTVRVYRANDSEHFLVAPVDDFAEYFKKIRTISTNLRTHSNDRKAEGALSRDQVRRLYEAQAK